MTRQASDAAPWIEWLARVGFVAKGVLYAVIGTLAGCAGMGHGGEMTDTRGAMHRLLRLPFGRIVLVVVAVGLIGYATWRLVEGFADPERRGTDAKGLALRSSFVVRGAVHLWLAFSAIRVVMGAQASSSGSQSEQATATAFRLPKGEWVVLAVALGIAGFGLYQVYRGIVAKLSRDVDERQIMNDAGRWLIVVSRVGIAARGVVFVAIGSLLFHAAREHDPKVAGGIADALNEVARLGQWPFVTTAAGLIAYGAYQLLSARYRRIRTV